MIHGGDWLGQEGRRPTTLGLAKSTFLIEDAERVEDAPEEMAQAPLQAIYHPGDSVLEMNLDCGIDNHPLTLLMYMPPVRAQASITFYATAAMSIRGSASPRSLR
jgi:hypothetical protein